MAHCDNIYVDISNSLSMLFSSFYFEFNPWEFLYGICVSGYDATEFCMLFLQIPQGIAQLHTGCYSKLQIVLHDFLCHNLDIP